MTQDPSSSDRAPRSEHSSRLVPLFCVIGAVLLWGTSFAATKTALSGFPPMAVVWLRMVAATIAFAPFWRRLPHPSYRPGDWKLLMITALLVPCLYFFIEAYAIRYTTSSQAGAVTAVAPLLVALGASIFLKERLGVRQIAAIVVSLAGVAALSLGNLAQASAPNPALGNALEFVAMVCSAGWMLAVRRLGERYNPWLLTAAQAAVGTVFFLPPALASGPASWATASPLAWASVAYLGVFVTIGAFGLYNTALTMMPASRASLAINLIPAVAVLTGWFALGESLTPVQLVVCAVILGSVILGESGRESDAAGEEEAVVPAAARLTPDPSTTGKATAKEVAPAEATAS